MVKIRLERCKSQIFFWKLCTHTWFNLHLHPCLSFEPNFGSFGLGEKFIKIEAKRSWNWSVMLKIVWKLKSSKSTQTWYNLHLHQYLSFEPNFGSFGLDEKFVKLEAPECALAKDFFTQVLNVNFCLRTVKIVIIILFDFSKQFVTKFCSFCQYVFE